MRRLPDGLWDGLSLGADEGTTEGENVGIATGCVDGAPLGREEGLFDGCNVGWDEGWPESMIYLAWFYNDTHYLQLLLPDGFWDGKVLGILVGSSDGAEDGAILGFIDGSPLGCDEGSLVGSPEVLNGVVCVTKYILPYVTSTIILSLKASNTWWTLRWNGTRSNRR
jgi:hypothetical protein